jgi:hypothetical protein
MSASRWIETTCLLAEPHNFRPQPRDGGFWRDLSLPLALPEAQVAALRNMAGRMDHACSDTRSGMIAIFTGRDAAGKLMAAEALAYEMQRPLHRVDSSEMSGAPDKHFARVLHAACSENAILMLDNAGSLPNRLLQSLKSYSGLSILTADSAQETSAALRESAHYIVDFPFPFDNE